MEKINLESLSAKQIITMVAMWQDTAIAKENRCFSEMVDRCYQSTPWHENAPIIYQHKADGRAGFGARKTCVEHVFSNIGSETSQFLAYDKEGRVSTGSVLPMAKAFLLYEQKASQDYGKNNHAGLNTPLSLEELIYCLCCSGFPIFVIRNWLERTDTIKESYTIAEFLELDEGSSWHDSLKDHFL